MRWKALLAGLALSVSTSAQAAWHEASSRHFVVYADQAPDELRAFTASLERFDKGMRVLRGFADPEISPSQRVTVFVLDDVGDIAKLYGRGGSDVAGFYNARASGSVAFVPRRGDGTGKYALTPQQVLFHEYTHHLTYAMGGGYFLPPWLVEGLAEFSATATVLPDGAMMFGAVPMYRLYGIAAVSPMPMKALLKASPAQLAPDQRETLYGRGWLLTHYFLTDIDRRKQLAAYLHALNSGKSPDEAAEALGVNTLDRQLTAYTREKLKGFTIPADQLGIGPIALRPLSPGEAAVMPARILSTRGVDAKSAPKVLALVQKSAAPFPNDPAAQNVLAEAEMDAGEPQAALAAADRALAADPKSLHALMYRGMALQAIAGAAGKHDPAGLMPARLAFVAANHNDPESPWPLEMNYLNIVASGQKPSTNAENGLLKAAGLAPFDSGLMLLAARISLGRGEPEEAKAYLHPIASDPHGGAGALFAAKLLALLDSGDKAGALTLFDTEMKTEKGAD